MRRSKLVLDLFLLHHLRFKLAARELVEGDILEGASILRATRLRCADVLL